jgi:hypothetical protein
MKISPHLRENHQNFVKKMMPKKKSKRQEVR